MVVLGLVSLMLFGKTANIETQLNRVESNTNGASDNDKRLVREMVEFLKTHNSVPNEVAPVVMRVDRTD